MSEYIIASEADESDDPDRRVYGPPQHEREVEDAGDRPYGPPQHRDDGPDDAGPAVTVRN